MSKELGVVTTKQIAKKLKSYYVPIWAPPEDFEVAGGKGPFLFDRKGKRYIDFVTGIAVNALGYQHPGLTMALKACLQKPAHVSSLFLQEDRVLLAEKLVKYSFGDKVFFCNSGTEANEGCIKFARKWAAVNFSEQKNEILAFRNGFHGRTYGALSATAQEKFHSGFKPMVPGFRYLEPNDLESFDQAADGTRVCAAILEVIQAEGGIVACDRDWLQQVRKICTERNIALILDEVQTGMGRLGALWGHQLSGVEPDLMSLAKALGGGIPFGAVVVKEKIASCLKVGDHGNTTGGSPFAAKLGLVVLAELLKPTFLKTVEGNAAFLKNELIKLQDKHPYKVIGTRGMGMLQGLVVNHEVPSLVAACRKRGLLVCKAGSNVLRLLPPLNVQSAVLEEAVAIIDRVLKSVS